MLPQNVLQGLLVRSRLAIQNCDILEKRGQQVQAPKASPLEQPPLAGHNLGTAARTGAVAAVLGSPQNVEQLCKSGFQDPHPALGRLNKRCRPGGGGGGDAPPPLVGHLLSGRLGLGPRGSVSAENLGIPYLKAARSNEITHGTQRDP